MANGIKMREASLSHDKLEEQISKLTATLLIRTSFKVGEPLFQGCG